MRITVTLTKAELYELGLSSSELLQSFVWAQIGGPKVDESIDIQLENVEYDVEVKLKNR